MRSWQVYDLNDMRLEDVPVPALKAGWALVKVKGVQPSITEIQRFWGKSKRGVDRMKKLIQETGPFPMGHEICGEVIEAPSGSGFQGGERVAYFHYRSGHDTSIYRRNLT